ncbi:Hypothetical protein A7982_07928 [Minicystis rosea]|nr:Hypothetical protein A7982_07928 [Minicystis rosea]
MFGAICLTPPQSVWAMPSEMVFDIVIPDGPDPVNETKVGTIYFELDAEMEDRCRYYGAWDDGTSATFEAECYMSEYKMFGHASCVSNSRKWFHTMVMLDARLPCAGFDTFGQQQRIFVLTGLEMPQPAGILGLIQWSAAAPMVSPFVAQPYP